MTWWEALVLGVIQGISEFFPVSSSGHLVMAQRLLGLSLPGIAFEIIVHVATLLSVLVVYWTKVKRLLLCVIGRGEEGGWAYIFKLILASVPAALAYALAGDWIEAQFDHPAFTGTMLLVTGSFLWSTRWARGTARTAWLEWVPVFVAAVVSLLAGTAVPFFAVLALQALIMGTSRASAPEEWEQEPGWGSAVAMGVAQTVALFPGISRSGSTVVTGLWRRVDAVAAAEFSFLMSVVAIAGSAVLKTPDVLAEGVGVGVVPLTVGFVAAAVSGVLAIRFFVALLRKQNFYTFAWYCWAVGALFLWYLRAAG